MNNHDTLESKDRKIRELQSKLLKLQNVQMKNTLNIYKKLDDSNTAQIELLREMNQLTKSGETVKLESAQFDILTQTIADNFKTINEQKSQIMKFQAQIDSDSVKLQKCRDELTNSFNLVREKNEIIAEQQNMAIVLNETQVKLEELKKSNLESQLGSFLPSTNSSEIAEIKLPGLNPFNVLCGSTATGAGWIVIQQRINGNVNFCRDWASYKAGFGSLDGDFFLGLEKIYQLTSYQPQELYIHLEEFDGTITYATYDRFAIADEDNEYRLISVDWFSGNATQYYMKYHKGKRFRTFDRDNEKKIAKRHHGGWWYGSNGTDCNLNGKYFNRKTFGKTSNFWYKDYSLKKVQMLIRPKLKIF